MGQQVHIKLHDVLANIRKEDKVEIYYEVFPADEQQGWEEKLSLKCRVHLMGDSPNNPNLSFELSLNDVGQSMYMDYNVWSDSYELKRQFIQRLGVPYSVF